MRRDRTRGSRLARRRVSVSAWLTLTCWLLGVSVLLYPTTASWFSQVNQSSLVGLYDAEIDEVKPDVATQLTAARAYNEALSAGALLAAGVNVAVGNGEMSGLPQDYRAQLKTPSGVMSRLRIPTINVDLPIAHGTDDDTLLRGLGHLEGTSLPVGGRSTRSVITGHRGLASSRMFTDLDRVKNGDTFTLETFGEVLTYRVTEILVVEPDQTETLHQVAGRDLVTLITCTPLGVNSHRILVTGERITPTPVKDIAAAGTPSGLPGFPWWAAGFVGAIAVGAMYVRWTTRPDTPRPKR
ncbi:class C sortase [Leucobacter aridicollis]|nr:class C sortase [Leucobacter aridicollis]